MRKLLIICGPTATSKTSLALDLAYKFDGELISADSRQVYKHMTIVTGKDIPKGFVYFPDKLKVPGVEVGYYSDGRTNIWGYDLVRPDQDFSVFLYKQFVESVVSKIDGSGKSPILVGGTGLYLNSVVKPTDRISIPPDAALRKKLESLDRKDLYRTLKKASPEYATRLNESDQKNPRRLIRAIEVAKHLSKKEESSDNIKNTQTTKKHGSDSVMWIGLTIENREELYKRIDKRVEERTGKQMDAEIAFLKRKDFLRHIPSRTIGYKQWLEYMAGNITKPAAIQKWKYTEHAYARRQITWFKKQKNVIWFDVSKENYRKEIEKVVEKWYSSDRNKKRASSSVGW